MSDTINRLKVLINSSTPIVVMETSEETLAVNTVREACSELNMATFEWTIADGLVRSGTSPSTEPAKSVARPDRAAAVGQSGYSELRTVLSPTSGEAERLMRAVAMGASSESASAVARNSIYNTRDPEQALANMESMTVEAVFILKDFTGTWMIPSWFDGYGMSDRSSRQIGEP